MFSVNAKAFCIESLLGLNSMELKDNQKSRKGVGEICPVPGQGTRCVHNSLQTIQDDNDNSKISMELCQTDLWHSFHALGTEMIITKSGRRMFPAIRCKFHGLEPKAKYRVYLDFIQLDKHKYRYVYHSSKWMVSGTGENMMAEQTYSHPDCPMEGQLLNSQIISFERLKLTNNERSRNGQISLLSMQRFLPRIHVEKLSAAGDPEEHYVTSFLQTSFMAVTAYQNQEITRLKIARNPFAKGFRESGKNRSSLEAMIECYGLQLADNEMHTRCPRKEIKVLSDQGMTNPLLPDSGFPVLFSPPDKIGYVKTEPLQDTNTTPSYNRYFSTDIRNIYDFCNNNVHVIHQDIVHSTTDTSSCRHQNIRPSPYSPTTYYTHFTVRPNLKVVHFDAT